MKKYVYDNAVVYITIPTDEQLENIRKSTERFVLQLTKKGLISNDHGKSNNRRISGVNTHAR